MNPFGLSILSALGVLILVGSQRWAVLALVAGIVYLTQGLALSVGGLSLYPVRILVVVLWLRILLRRESARLSVNRIDVAFICLYLYTLGVFLMRSDEGQVFQIGTTVDALLSYFGFRTLIRTLDDVTWLLRGIAVLLVPYVPLVWIESTTFVNHFAPLGGVELARAGDLWVREGRLRATGSFGHPSLLGTLGGTFLALYLPMLFTRDGRAFGLLGVGICLGIVGAANSGGPASCVAVVLVGWLLWPLRTQMEWVRRALLAVVLLLAVSMKAPIWYLIARVSSITGGDGHHRAVLLDIGFQNLDRWWLAGMPFRETSKWLPYTNTATGFVDLTNTFLEFGVIAGLGAIILLIALLTVAYSHLGRAIRGVRSRLPRTSGIEHVYWSLGVVVAVHIVNWFGITYWDQTKYLWFLHLAILSSLSERVLGKDQPHRLHKRKFLHHKVAASPLRPRYPNGPRAIGR